MHFRVAQIAGFVIHLRSWMLIVHALPDDIAALKAALAVERAREASAERDAARRAGGRAGEGVGRRGADRPAEAADRQARAPDLRPAIGALGAADRPAGAEVRRAGSRAPRKTSWRRKGRRQDDDGARIYAQARRAQHLPRPPSARAGGDRSADGVRVLRRQSLCASSART